MSRKNSRVGLFEVASKTGSSRKPSILRLKRKKSFSKLNDGIMPEAVDMPAKTQQAEKPKVKVNLRIGLIAAIVRNKKAFLIGFSAVLVIFLVYRLAFHTPAAEIADPGVTKTENEATGTVDSGGEVAGNIDGSGVPLDVAVPDTVIVLAYVPVNQGSRAFEPVIEYFASNGIEIEIKKTLSNYLLITKDRFSNPNKAGSDGEEALNRIKKIGLGYKTPAGYANFGKKPFQSAYGM